MKDSLEQQDLKHDSVVETPKTIKIVKETSINTDAAFFTKYAIINEKLENTFFHPI